MSGVALGASDTAESKFLFFDRMFQQKGHNVRVKKTTTDPDLRKLE